MSCCGTIDLDLIQKAAVAPAEPFDGPQATSFVVPDMHCASCIAKIEGGLAALADVSKARANLSTRQVDVIWQGGPETPERIIEAISRLGFASHVLETADAEEDALRRRSRHLLLCLAVAGFAAANIMLLSVSVWSGAEPETARLFALISGLIAVPAIFYAGTPFFSSALRALSARQLNMDVPISLAVLLSLFMSLYEALIGGGETFFDAGVMLLFFLLIGRTLDHLMREKAASGVKTLVGLLPNRVVRLFDDGTTAKIDLHAVRNGMILQLLPGDRFPVDAKIAAGATSVDRSVVTGEAGAIPARTGDVLEAGTLNLTGQIRIEAISDAQTSFLAEVMDMMKAAEHGKGRYRRIADRMAAIYAPAVHLLALVTFVIWVALTGEVKASLVAAIAVLIITCPCALALAVPVTHVVAANRLFREGILMRDGSALERLAEADTVFFDKTGTLTDDTLRLVDPPKLPRAEARVLATLASASRHPAARAIAHAYSTQDQTTLQDVQEEPAFGIEAKVAGRRVRLGRADWVSQLDNGSDKPDNASTTFAIEGGSTWAFHLTSDLKADALEAVSRTNRDGMRTAILSGDTASNVATVAMQTGIRHWQAGLTPQQKIEAIKRSDQDGNHALMVGDGLNDAPSLMAAHVSMAPASAMDVSRASADFVFTRPSLLAVPFALRLSRASASIVRQNFGIAIAYNCVAVPLAMLGYVTPLVAALAMSLSSIVVVANALRLTLFTGERNAKGSAASARPMKTAMGGVTQ